MSTTAAADKDSMDDQLLKWVNKEERVAAQMQEVVDEVGVCEAKRAEAAVDLESKLSREAVATTVKQTQRVETVCAGVRQQVAKEVTACEGVAANMHTELGNFQQTLSAHITAASEANSATHGQQLAELVALAEARSKSEEEISSTVTNTRALVDASASEVATASKSATSSLTEFSGARAQWWSSFVQDETDAAQRLLADSAAEKQEADARVSAGEEHFAKAAQTLGDMTERFADAQQQSHEQVVEQVDGGSNSVQRLRQQTTEATEKIPAPHALAAPEVERQISCTPEDLEVENKHKFVRFDGSKYDSEHKDEAAAAAAAEAAAAAATEGEKEEADETEQLPPAPVEVPSAPETNAEPARKERKSSNAKAPKARGRRSADAENSQRQNTGLPPRGKAKTRARSRSRSRSKITRPKTRSRSGSSSRRVLTSR